MKKQELLDMVESLPDQFDPERLMHDLYVRAKLERAERAVERGEIISHDEVVERSREWSK